MYDSLDEVRIDTSTGTSTPTGSIASFRIYANSAEVELMLMHFVTFASSCILNWPNASLPASLENEISYTSAPAANEHGEPTGHSSTLSPRAKSPSETKLG